MAGNIWLTCRPPAGGLLVAVGIRQTSHRARRFFPRAAAHRALVGRSLSIQVGECGPRVWGLWLWLCFAASPGGRDRPPIHQVRGARSRKGGSVRDCSGRPDGRRRGVQSWLAAFRAYLSPWIPKDQNPGTRGPRRKTGEISIQSSQPTIILLIINHQLRLLLLHLLAWDYYRHFLIKKGER